MAEQQKNLSYHFKSHAGFPWRSRNHVRLHINAESFYPAMLRAISAAQETIFLEMYLIESGAIATDFIDTFLLAAQRQVKIFILLDDFGCYGLSQEDRQRLQHENIFLTFYNPLQFYNPLYFSKFRRNLFRDHRKILIIDQKSVFVGGAGITDDFLTKHLDNPGWRETMIEVQGECIPDWIDLFKEAWLMYAKDSLPYFEKKWESKGNELSETMRQTCRVVCAMGSSRQGIKRSLIKRIRTAEQRIWISTAYFLPSFKVRRALIRAAKRGVDVRLLLPGDKSDHPSVRQAGRRFYYNLLRSGVTILEYQPRFIHQKILMCDQWVSIGSSNIDRWNFRWNLEANQEVEDSIFTHEVVKMFEADFKQSEIFEFKRWLQRSWYYRAQEWFWGKIDRLFDRFIK